MSELPDDTKVICPECVNQFRAIPVQVQRLLLDAGFEPPFTAAPPAARDDVLRLAIQASIVEAAYQTANAILPFRNDGTERRAVDVRNDILNAIDALGRRAMSAHLRARPAPEAPAAVELPPLPKGDYSGWDGREFTHVQMREYAFAALAASRGK